MKGLLGLPVRRPYATLALAALLTAGFGFFAASLEVDSSIEKLLPSGDPERLFYEQVREEFGSEEIGVVGVFAEDVFRPSTLEKIDAVTRELASLEGIREAVGLTTVEGVELTDEGLRTGRLLRSLPRTDAEARAFRERVLSTPIYVRNVVSPDARAAAITLSFERMSDDELIASGLDGRVRAVLRNYEGPERFALTGIPTIKVHAARYMMEDTARFLPLAVLLAMVVLLLEFRTLRGVFVPLAAVLVGVVWTTGFMSALGARITMGTLVLPPLLMAIGVAYAIHMMAQYYRAAEGAGSGSEAASAMLEEVRLPVFVAALTTVVGFASFLLTPIPAIREFGAFSVFGISAVLFASFTVVPAFLAVLRVQQRIREHRRERVSSLVASVGDFAVRRRNLVLFGGAVACGLAVWGVRNLGVETDYLGFFSPRDHVRVENREISEKLAGTQPLSVVVTGDEPRAVTRLRVLRAIHELQRYVETLPGVDTTLSLVDYLYLVRRALDPEAPPLPASQEEIEQLLLLVDPAEIEGVANRDLSRANVVVRTRLSSSGDIDALVDNITAFAREHFPRGVTVRPTGTIVLLARSADTLVRGQVTGLWQVVFVLFVLMSVLFLSLRVGLLSLVPNVVPILLLFGLMGWWGFDLNISTALIAALAIGIAVDDTIHYLTAFNAGLRKTADQAKAVAEAARTVGSPIVFTSVALVAGFLVVCLSNFRPVQDFGLLSATTMGIALLSDLVLTPAVLMTTKIVTLWEVLFLKLGPEPHKQIPLFHGLRPFQAKIVVLMARLANAPAGTAITRRGELRDELYVLLGGRAEVRRDAEGPVLRSLGRGDVVGEMGLVRHQPRTADVIVVEEAEYLILDRAFLRRLPRRYPRIAARVFLNLTRILSDRLETTTDQLAAARPAQAAS